MTQTTQAVLRTLLDDPTKDLYGLEICAATGLPSGTVHPILARFEALAGSTARGSRSIRASRVGPRRRYYRLNPNGVELARDALARAYATRTRIVSRLKPIGGYRPDRQISGGQWNCRDDQVQPVDGEQSGNSRNRRIRRRCWPATRRESLLPVRSAVSAATPSANRPTTPMAATIGHGGDQRQRAPVDRHGCRRAWSRRPSVAPSGIARW